MDPQRVTILLKEYDICQQTIRDHSTRFCAIMSIFMPLSTALLGALVAAVAAGVTDVFVVSDWWRLGLVTVFSIGMVGSLWSLRRWLNRINHYVRVTYYRTREIEHCLGMLQHSTIH